MIIVKSVEWEGKPGVGCNNGVTDNVTVTFNNGESVYLTTCRCGRGCHGLDCVPSVGDSFKDMDDFWDFSNPDY